MTLAGMASTAPMPSSAGSTWAGSATRIHAQNNRNVKTHHMPMLPSRRVTKDQVEIRMDHGST